MSSAFTPSLWRRHLWLWLGPLLLVIFNAGLLSFYRSVYSGRVAQLERQYEVDLERVAVLSEQRRQAEELLRTAQTSRDGIERLYGEHFATERERLTQVIREVKQLATEAGFQVAAISYPEEEFEDHGVARMSFVFNVQGSYSNLRRFINSLELTDSFITLESIRVSEAEGSLAISLHLSTLFADEPPPTRPARSAAGGSR